MLTKNKNYLIVSCLLGSGNADDGIGIAFPDGNIVCIWVKK